jgi:hypothetical protein
LLNLAGGSAVALRCGLGAEVEIGLAFPIFLRCLIAATACRQRGCIFVAEIGGDDWPGPGGAVKRPGIAAQKVAC